VGHSAQEPGRDGQRQGGAGCQQHITQCKRKDRGDEQCFSPDATDEQPRQGECGKHNDCSVNPVNAPTADSCTPSSRLISGKRPEGSSSVVAAVKPAADRTKSPARGILAGGPGAGTAGGAAAGSRNGPTDVSICNLLPSLGTGTL
jgi:hypothetical protein